MHLGPSGQTGAVNDWESVNESLPFGCAAPPEENGAMVAMPACDRNT